MSDVQRTAILAVSSEIPTKVLSNDDLAEMVDTNDEWIVTRTGIRERRILSEDERLADFASAAGRKAIQKAGLSKDDIDLVIVSTFTPERLCPSISCEVQEQLDLGRTPAMDVNAACSGFVYGLHLAHGLISAGMHKNILLIGAEAHSRIVDFTDRSTCILFGDGASAVVVGTANNGSGIYGSVLGADGKGKELITVNPGEEPLDPSLSKNSATPRQLLRMQGREVFRFAVNMVGEALDEVLAASGLQPTDVDLLVPHQANIRIIQAAAKRLSLPEEKVFVNIERYGNTAAASIPIALDEAEQSGRLKKGDTVVTVGFGAGFTYGATIFKW